MKTSSETRIRQLEESGDWGSDTLHAMLAHWAQQNPNSLAVVDQPNRETLTGDQPQSLNWSELDAASTNLAEQLAKQGIASGDKVIVQLPNIVELVVCYFALSKLGAIVSPLPVQYGAHELQLAASALKPKLFISLPHFKELPLAANARAALPEVNVLEFGAGLVLKQDEGVSLDPVNKAGFTCAKDANQILTIVWTSGTTGSPKGVPRSHNMWLASGRTSATAASVNFNDRLLCPFPLVNMAAIGGLLVPALLFGCPLFLHHPFDPAIFLQQLKQESVSYTVVPPAMLNQLAKNPQSWRQLELDSIRTLASGSAPLAPWMIKTFREEFGIEVVNMYGSNEGIALYATPENAPDAETRAGMFKKPEDSQFSTTKVADPETGEVKRNKGERGELLVKGATVFDGYLEHDNKDVFDPQGFFRTGDLVEICGEHDEYYRIVGRCKDIINRGGMKISPTEIDLLLESYPDALEAAVCAYPDERLSEKICACMVMAPGSAAPTLESLQAWLLDKGLAKFKLPERIVLFDALPRNPLGKIKRFELSESLD